MSFLARASGARARWACLLVAPIVALSGEALAQPSVTDKALAEPLFRDAQKLFDQKRVPEACAKFAESYRLDPALGTLLNLATCHEEEGRTASAWAEFTEGLARATATKNAQRTTYARDHVRGLEPRLSRIVLEIEAPAEGMKVRLGDRELTAAAAVGTSIPVDPGPLSLEVIAPGKKPHTRTLTIPRGPSNQSIHVMPLEDVQVEVKTPEPKPPEPVIPAPSGLHGRRVAALAVGGVGVAGIAAGSVFGVMTLSRAKQVEGECGRESSCPSATVDVNKKAYTSATVSTVAFGVGAAFAVTGLILWFTAPSRPEPEKAGIFRVLPVAGPSGGGLVAGGVF